MDWNETYLKTMKISTVIFDMNGVITDDEDCHELATKKAFEKVGLEITPELYRKFCLGRTDSSAFRDLIETYELKHTGIGDLIAGKTQLYMHLVKDNLKIYPGIIDLIRELSTTYILALTTSSTFAEAQTVIEHLKLKKYFKVVITAKDVKKGKPDPEPYQLTLKKLGVAAEDCMVIEDSANGVASAKAAGIRCIAIANSEKSENLRMADAIVDYCSQITTDFIEKIGIM
jgi:HAD superfamily hydrolase (TIGR01509 family)